MSNPALRLENISIAGFRGIRGEPRFDLDLSARLTVLVAPNGTGKTSICQAAEWLMTGEVNGFKKAEELAFKGPATPPEVHGVVRVGDVRSPFARTAKGWTAQRGENGATVSTPSEILAWIAPDAVDLDKGISALNDRRAWVRGTRFLSMSDLAVLIDSQKDVKDARRKILADLFGVQHLDLMDRRLSEYGKVVRRECEDAARKVAALSADLRQLPGGDTEGGEGASRGKLLEACAALDLSPPEANDRFETVLDRTRAALEYQERAHAAKDEALRTLETLDEPVSSLKLKREKSSKALTEAGLDVTRLSDRVRMLEGDRERLKARIGRLKAARDTLRDAERNAIAFVGTDQTERHLREEYPEIEWSEQTIRNRCDALEQFKDQLFQHKQNVLQHQTVAAKLDGGAGPSPEAVDEARRAVQEHEAKLAALNEQATETDGALTDLRRAARHLVEEAPEHTTDCPLCGHDWQGHDALRKAVQRTLKALPSAATRITAQLDAAEASLKEAKDRVAQLTRQQALKAELDVLERKLADQHDRAARLALAEPWDVAVSEAQKRLKAAPPLARLLKALAEAEAELGIDDASRKSIRNRLTDADLSSALRNTQEDDEEKRQDIRVLSDELARAKPVQNREKESLRLLDDRLGNARGALRSLFGADAADDQDLVAARQSLEAERERLSAARIALDTAEAVEANSRLAKKRADLQAQLEAAREELAFLEHQRLIATSTHEKVTAHRKGAVKRQMEALWPQVNSLFMRVHANRVFERINYGDDPLEWSGDFGSHDLETKNFSAGQRQDLALALFLARATSLKGTFFLDEPLAHLDDLNRVAVLDVLRMIALTTPGLNLVLTTASRPLARHIREKFGRIKVHDGADRDALLQVWELAGSPKGELTKTRL